MSVLKSMCMAFAMYSKIPMPKIEWEAKNMKYVLCFFPLIGIVQGIIFYFLWTIRECIGVYLPFPMFVLVGCVVPVVLTGGIHMDGFLDTMDALHSWQEKEKKLEILKDPHVGAFACISLVCYFCLYGAGLYLIQTRRQLLFLTVGFFLSRTFSAVTLILVKSAKKDGLLYTFATNAQKKMVMLVLFVGCVSAFFASWLLYGMHGLTAVFLSLLVVFIYISMAQKRFGGLTGDLAGFFVTVYELVFLWIAGSMELIWYWW